MEKQRKPFGHEQLNVYQVSIEYIGWVHQHTSAITGHKNAKEQLVRAAQSIPLNIAEGNGKATEGERRQYFEIARGSALECAATQDILEVCGALSHEENEMAKLFLDRVIAMLTKLGNRCYAVGEGPVEYVMGPAE